MLDDVDRARFREHLDPLLEKPFDPGEAAEFDRERWGATPDALGELSASERAFEAVTYSEAGEP